LPLGEGLETAKGLVETGQPVHLIGREINRRFIGSLCLFESDVGLAATALLPAAVTRVVAQDVAHCLGSDRKKSGPGSPWAAAAGRQASGMPHGPVPWWSA
jgi:hypothetical protein